MNETEYLIVGAGPTGLGAATRLHERGGDWHLVEAAPGFGGLAATFVDEQGFTWDLGGHVQFSHYDDLRPLHATPRWARTAGSRTSARAGSGSAAAGCPYPVPEQPAPPRPRRPLGRPARACCRRTSARRNAAGGAAGALRRLDASPPSARASPTSSCAPTTSRCGPFRPPRTMDYGWIGERVAVPALEGRAQVGVHRRGRRLVGPQRGVSVFPAMAAPAPSGARSAAGCPGARDARRRGHRTSMSPPGSSCAPQRAHLSGATPPHQHPAAQPPDPPGPRRGRARGARPTAWCIPPPTWSASACPGQPPEHLRTKCWMYFPEANSPVLPRDRVQQLQPAQRAASPGEQWSLMTETAESAAKPVDVSNLVADDRARTARGRPDPRGHGNPLRHPPPPGPGLSHPLPRPRRAGRPAAARLRGEADLSAAAASAPGNTKSPTRTTPSPRATSAWSGCAPPAAPSSSPPCTPRRWSTRAAIPDHVRPSRRRMMDGTCRATRTARAQP
jgi:hypothetical protein